MRAVRSTLLVALIPSVLVGALYLREAAPSVGGGNSGEFQVMSHLLGIAHPPSYPLYLLLAKGASLVPIGDVAWRVNVLTALLGAAAIFLAGLLAGDLSADRPKAWLAALVAGSGMGIMPRLWSLALEAEVFTLHLVLTLGFWLALHHRRLAVAALLAGLGLANHRTFLFTAAAGALFLAVQRPSPRAIIRALPFLVSGLVPYLYVIRGLVMPVAYFSPTDVRPLSRGEVWYVLQGNATGETGGGAVVLQLLADRGLLAQRYEWLIGHLLAQLGPVAPFSAALAVGGAVGLALLARRATALVATAVLGALGAALFAMSYSKYPDADRYLLPLETLVAIGLGATGATIARRLGRLLEPLRPLATLTGLASLAAGTLYVVASLALLATRTSFTRGGYVHHTVHNLEGVEPRLSAGASAQGAVVCSWWSSVWGLWYAQYVDGVRPDIAVIAKGPDDCLRDVLPSEFGRRPVYFPALTEQMRRSEFVFFPSRDLWLAVARTPALSPGALLKGPDDRIYLFDGARRRWIPSLAVFEAHGFRWEDVRLTGEYALREMPEGEPLSS